MHSFKFRLATGVFIALLSPLAALADSITSISPRQFFLGSVEEFLVVNGENLMGTQSTRVVFVGPAGTFSVEPGYVAPTRLETWLPVEVLVTPGQYNVTVRAQDATAVRTIGSASFVVSERTVVGPPLISAPEAVVAEATSADGAFVTFHVSGRSDSGTPPAIACDHAMQGMYPLGSTSVICTATDAFGTASAQFAVFVTDTRPPVLTLPANITTQTAVVEYTATAVDNISGSVPVSCNRASGSSFPTGLTTVTCFAEDAHFNRTTGSFTVKVGETVAPPTLTLPQDLVVEATGPTGATVLYTVTASSGATVSCNPPSGSTFAIGSKAVDCTATDSLNQSASGTFNVTVRDTTPPLLISLLASPNVLTPPNHKMTSVQLTVIATDAVGPTVARIVSVTSNQPDNGTGDGDTPGDTSITGPLSVDLRAERAPSGDRVYTITVEVIDGNGNATRGSVEVRVPVAPGRQRSSR